METRSMWVGETNYADGRGDGVDGGEQEDGVKTNKTQLKAERMQVMPLPSCHARRSTVSWNRWTSQSY